MIMKDLVPQGVLDLRDHENPGTPAAAVRIQAADPADARALRCQRALAFPGFRIR
jgi:hypothetical protein